MYFVKIAPREYAEASLFSFYSVEAAGDFMKSVITAAVPNEYGKRPVVTVWEESEADADPKGAEPDSNEVVDYDDGSGVGQTFSP